MLTAIVLTTGLTLVLFLTGLFVVFTPLPVIFTILRKGPAPAFLASVAALASLVLLYRLPDSPMSFLPMMVFHPTVSLSGVIVFSTVYFFYYLWLGWVTALASRRTGRFSSLEPSVAIMTVLGLALPFLGLVILSGWMKLDLWGDLSRGLQTLFQRLIDLQQVAGIEEEDLAILRASAPGVVAKFLQVLPSLWIDLTLGVLSLNVLFLRRWSPKDRPFPNWPDFGLWRLKEAWIWAPIVVGFAYFLNTYLIGSSVLYVVAVNVLIVLAAIYFFQGLAVASFFFRAKFSPLMRLIGYAAFLLFFQVGAVVVILMGLADFWFDFRKLKKVA